MPPIENTELTTEWLEMILSPRCGKSKITSYELRKSTDYVGYISRVLALELQWQSDNAELPKHILFKIPQRRENKVMAVKADTEYDWLPVIHATECMFYDTFGSLRGLKVPRCYFTRVMSANNCGVIVMEHILNGHHGDVVVGFSRDQVNKYIDTITVLHADCLTRQDDWQKQFPHTIDGLTQLWKIMDGILPKLFALQPGRFDSKVNSISHLLHKTRLAEFMLESHKKLALPCVLAHGDVWLNNMIWSNGDNKNLLAIIDWQLARPGCHMEDVALMLARGYGYKERRAEWRDICGYYHKALSAQMQLHNATVPYTVEDCYKTFEYILPFALNGLLLAVPFICDWNAANMNDADKESMFANIDALLDDVIELDKKGTYEI